MLIYQDQNATIKGTCGTQVLHKMQQLRVIVPSNVAAS